MHRTAVLQNLLNLIQAAGRIIGALGLALGAALADLSGGSLHCQQTGLDAMISNGVGK